MLIKKGMLKIIGLTATAVIVPTAVIGGYFLISKADRYRGFYTNPLNDGTSAMVNAYKGAVLQGANTIMTPGYNHEQPIVTSFEEAPDFFKDIGFLFFDGKVVDNSRAAANTWNITYRTDLGSIQVGIAAAYFLNYYQDVFLNNGANDGTLTYAMWGGLSFSSVISFMGGFQHGIKWANDNLAGKTINGFTYKEVMRLGEDKTPNVMYDDFTGGFGPSDGVNTMSKIISGRPDILMPVAGPQIWTASDLISLIDSKTLLIGVDSTVEDDTRNPDLNFKTPGGKVIGNGKRVQFSSLKNLARSTETALNIINNGNIVPQHDSADKRYHNFSQSGTAGENGGYGTIAVGDSVNGCVGVSEAGSSYFNDALKLAGSAGAVDPSTNAIYTLPSNMVYVAYNGTKYSFAWDDPRGLQKDFAENNKSGFSTLNKKGFIQHGNANGKDNFKIILSSANSILMDASFSQSCYTGLYLYLKSEGIEIPAPVGGAF